jgi:hypothetical protein
VRFAGEVRKRERFFTGKVDRIVFGPAVTAGSSDTLYKLPAASIIVAGRLPALFAETATAAAGALCLGASFVDVKRPAVEILAVQCGNRPITLAIVAHLDESEAAWLTGIAVGDNIDAIHGAVSFKKRANRLLRRSKAEISHKNIFHTRKILY